MELEHQTPLIGAYLLLMTKDGILLSQRGSGQLKGFYSLIAGHTEKGETVIEAIVREAKEEANITLKPENLSVVCAIQRPQSNYKGVQTDIIDFFIKADTYEGPICNMEPDKCSELAFFDIQKLPTNLLPQVYKALDLFNKGQFYSHI